MKITDNVPLIVALSFSLILGFFMTFWGVCNFRLWMQEFKLTFWQSIDHRKRYLEQITR